MYADEDKDFILQKLDFLEEKSNLRLCLHSRDFIPGTDIADNIVNAIHQSRRTLCVLSSHFFDSYWCMYELNMARMESIYSRKGSNILCLVVMNKTVFQNIRLKIIDLHMWNIMNMKTMIRHFGIRCVKFYNHSCRDKRDVKLVAYIQDDI